MAKLIDRPLIKKVTPIAPEHLVGDLIQSGHPLFGLVWINPERVSGAPCFYGLGMDDLRPFQFEPREILAKPIRIVAGGSS